MLRVFSPPLVRLTHNMCFQTYILETEWSGLYIGGVIFRVRGNRWAHFAVYGNGRYVGFDFMDGHRRVHARGHRHYRTNCRVHCVMKVCVCDWVVCVCVRCL